jgi:hypothetical protein
MTDILKAMQALLPSAAYKRHGGKSFLTSIDATYTRERLTEIFGAYGVGWGLTWHPDNAKDWMTEGKQGYHFALLQAEFWFVLDGERVSFPVTGYNNSDNLGDAMEGARTNAVSSGAKALLFQLHVYKDKPAPQAGSPTTGTPPKNQPAKSQPKSGNGNVSTDPMTTYWTAVNARKIKQAEGQRTLESANGDPVQALAALEANGGPS